MIKVKFYGTRGSIPVCDPKFQEFGGNTTCLQVTDMKTNRIGIFDAGTGIRDLGNDLVASGHEQDQIFIMFSHFHWDHIQGFPFFAKAYDPKQIINIFAMGKGRNIKDLKSLFTTLMQSEYFPVPLDKMGASFEFIQPDISSGIFGPLHVKVTANRHNHPGGAYGYRLERGGKSLVFCTDIEHGDNIDQNVWKYLLNEWEILYRLFPFLSHCNETKSFVVWGTWILLRICHFSKKQALFGLQKKPFIF